MTELDVEKLTNAELLEEVERQAAGEPARFAYSSEWLKRLMEKKAKPEDFDAALVKGYRQKLPKMLEAFKKGELFGCQGLDFTSMLMCKEAEVDHDMALWNSVDTMLHVQGLGETLEHNELFDFARTRVTLNFKTRRSFLEENGVPKLELGEAKAKAKEAMRKEFERVGVQWKWWWRTWDKIEQAKLKAEYGLA